MDLLVCAIPPALPNFVAVSNATEIYLSTLRVKLLIQGPAPAWMCIDLIDRM